MHLAHNAFLAHHGFGIVVIIEYVKIYPKSHENNNKTAMISLFNQKTYIFLVCNKDLFIF
jgi:hypothetical protein